MRARCAAGSASKFSADSRIWTTGGHYYDDVPCNHGHSKIEAEFQLALQDALGLFQYVWY